MKVHSDRNKSIIGPSPVGPLILFLIIADAFMLYYGYYPHIIVWVLGRYGNQLYDTTVNKDHEHEGRRSILEARVQPVRRGLVQQERIPQELQQQKVQVPVLEQGEGALMAVVVRDSSTMPLGMDVQCLSAWTKAAARS